MASAFPMITRCSAAQWRGYTDLERERARRMGAPAALALSEKPYTVSAYALWWAEVEHLSLPQRMLVSVKVVSWDAPGLEEKT